jgi:uncharacterized protein (DUF427 family)
MPKAVWNDTVIADSNQTIKVEGNDYFPPSSVRREYLVDSQTHTTCHWKGLASYYDVVVDGKVSRDGAWYYHDPSQEAAQIKDYVAFWHGVKVIP